MSSSSSSDSDSSGSLADSPSCSSPLGTCAISSFFSITAANASVRFCGLLTSYRSVRLSWRHQRFAQQPTTMPSALIEAAGDAMLEWSLQCDIDISHLQSTCAVRWNEDEMDPRKLTSKEHAELLALVNNPHIQHEDDVCVRGPGR